MLNKKRWLVIIVAMRAIGLVFIIITQSVFASSTHLSIIKYDNTSQLLFMNVVAPIGKGQLYLQVDGILIKIERFSRVGDYQLRVYLPCDQFDATDSLFYRVDDVILTLSLASIACSSKEGKSIPRIIHQGGLCIIEPKGTTLWQVGILLQELNGYTVHQNIYAVFIRNRGNFIDEDINKMKNMLMYCPSEKLISSIEKQHAISLFKEAEKYRRNVN